MCGTREDRGPVKKCRDFIFSDWLLLPNETWARKPACFQQEAEYTYTSGFTSGTFMHGLGVKT